jgi:gliding motility-associated lipoprotein GldH
MKKFVLLLPLFLLFSCTNSIVTEITKDFPNNTWKKREGKTFEFDMIADKGAAKLAVKFSHIYDPGYTSVPIRIIIKHPDGQIETQTTTLELRDEKGKDLSDCAGDICDLKQVVIKHSPFHKGSYNVTIQNNFKQGDLPNVLALGIMVEE